MEDYFLINLSNFLIVKKCLILLFFTCSHLLTNGQETWDVDPTNSSIEFRVGHLLITSVPGRFNSFNAQIETTEDDNFNHSRLEASIKVSSVDTGNKQRDGHILSTEFFQADSFPIITFSNAELELIDEKKIRVKGDLTMKGVTKSVTF